MATAAEEVFKCVRVTWMHVREDGHDRRRLSVCVCTYTSLTTNQHPPTTTPTHTPQHNNRRKAYVEMGKCWTFAGVNNQALKALRAVYKAEENKAVRVRGCMCVRVVLFCVERLIWLGGRRSFPFRSLNGLPVGVHPHPKPPTQPPPSTPPPTPHRRC